MSILRIVCTAFALVAVAAVSHAEVLKVPAAFATIQEAVDAAGVGDVVLIAPGTYAENVGLQGKSGFEIRGLGKVLIDGGLTAAALQLEDCEDVRLVNLRVTRGPSTCLLILECERITVDRCRAQNSAQDGFTIAASTDTLLVKCRVSECERHGVSVEATGGTVLDRCRIEASGDDGVHVQDLDDPAVLTLVKCLIRDVLGDGVDALDSQLVRLQDCQLLDCGESGVEAHFSSSPLDLQVQVNGGRVERPGDGFTALDIQGSLSSVRGARIRDAHVGVRGNLGVVQVNGCDIRKVETDAIRLLNSNTDVKDNVIRDCGSGISLEGEDADVSGNDLRRIDLAAITVASSSHDTEVHDNVIRDAGSGVFLITTDAVTVADNVISKIQSTGVAIVSASTNVVVSGNQISHCEIGVDTDSDGTLVTGNLVTGATQDGIRIGGNVCVVEGNTVKKAGANGFVIDALIEGCLLSGNTSKKAGQVGFFLDSNSTGNTLTLNVASGSGLFDLQDDGTANDVAGDNLFGSVAP